MNSGSSSQIAEQVMAAITDAVFVVDDDGAVDYCNRAAAELVESEPDKLLGRPLSSLFKLHLESAGPDQFAPGLVVGELAEYEGQPLLMRTSERRRELPVEVSERPRFGPDGQALGGAVLVVKDVSARRRIELNLQRAASHDPLTGLLNRREFDNRLNVLVEDAQVSPRSHALLYVDVDQFKVVNDTCGHVAGDELLRELGTYLQRMLRKGDIVGRIGGDEFGILLRNVHEREAMRLADSVCGGLSSFRFRWREASFAPTVSIGVALIDERVRAASQLMQQVDTACFAAKDMGRNRVHRYSEGDAEMTQRRSEMEWLPRLQTALEQGWFRIAVQKMESLHPEAGRPLAEVLLRLRDGGDGPLVPPGLFIPAAERYNLMPSIDRWVVQTVIEAIASGALERFGERQFTINLSGLTLTDDSFAGWVIDLFTRSRVPTNSVCFEITETAAVAGYARAIRMMSTLRQLGCSFALDDFGSGMSSFGYLRQFPVDYLKIDGMFVRDMDTDSFHRAIVRSITEVDKAAGLKTIAEFVENEATLISLREIGVDYAQGFHIHKPELVED